MYLLSMLFFPFHYIFLRSTTIRLDLDSRQGNTTLHAGILRLGGTVVSGYVAGDDEMHVGVLGILGIMWVLGPRSTSQLWYYPCSKYPEVCSTDLPGLAAPAGWVGGAKPEIVTFLH